MTKEKVYKTSDLALAAYMITQGMVLLKATKLESGRYHFEIADPEDLADKCKLEFINSEYYRFDNNLKMLKKMIYS